MKLYRDFETQEEIDAQYDLIPTVPDFNVYVDLYVNGSAEARKSLKHTPDVRFGPTKDEYLDIFPAEKPGGPILIFIHGGYWKMLSAKENSICARGLVPKGVNVLITNYSLCPKVTLPEITRQTRAAIAWAYRNAESFGGDKSRIFVAGHSAGGHQTAMACITDWEGEYGLPADLIKGGIPISGVHDLGALPYSHLQPVLQIDWKTVETQSPLRNIPDRGPKMLTTVGGKEPDEFVRLTKDFTAAWQARGLEAEYFPQPDKNHFDAIDGFWDNGSPFAGKIAEFIGI
ncbi:MAG: alpha/beta hydrolase [Alphaproteobacteria bacterium]